MNQTHQPFKFSLAVIVLPLAFVLLMWLGYWADVRFKLSLSEYGIYPRQWFGLKGVLLSPFIHGDMEHLFNNSAPILVLTAALRYFYGEIFNRVFLLGFLLTGLFTWLIGRESYHIGASGMVYFLASFILFKGLQVKYYRLVALSLLVVLLYGGMVWYMFPGVKENMSWEGHLSGFSVGLLLSFIFKVEPPEVEAKFDWQKPDFVPELDPFMRHFDENGQFVNTPKPEEEIKKHFTSSIDVVYEYLGKK
jgi:membrane associated rhomboid family serine protease